MAVPEKIYVMAIHVIIINVLSGKHRITNVNFFFLLKKVNLTHPIGDIRLLLFY